MMSEFPTVFKTSSTNLEISHDIDDYDERLRLFGDNDYYFQQETQAGSSAGSPELFGIQFNDRCQTATITSQELEDFTVEWQAQTSLNIAIPVFTDSVDSNGDLELGICGPKVMTLDDGSPSFLTLTQDESQDPANEPYQLTYDDSLATEADVKVHTINYIVSVPVYNGIIADLQGSFNFEILPRSITSEISPSDETQDGAFTFKRSRRAPISLDSIAPTYVTYFNETSELIFNFADPEIIQQGNDTEQDSSSPLLIEMIANSLPFVPSLVTDYSDGVGLGELKVTIDGQKAYAEASQQIAEDSSGDIEVNGVVTIRVSYVATEEETSALSSLFYLNFHVKSHENDDGV